MRLKYWFTPFILAAVSIGDFTRQDQSTDPEPFHGSRYPSATSKRPRKNEASHLLERRSSDDDEAFVRSRTPLSPSNARRRQLWQERMTRVRTGAATANDYNFIENFRNYRRGYEKDLVEGERRRLESGEMTFEELEKIERRRLKRRVRASKKYYDRKERIESGQWTEKDLELVEAQRARRRISDKKARAARKPDWKQATRRRKTRTRKSVNAP